MPYYLKNEEKNGIEIYFEKKPSDDICNKLKTNGWRWNRPKSCWYNYYSDRAIRFYNEIFGLQVILNQDSNVIMSEGLVLQDAAIWKEFLDKELIPKNNMTELYFEETDIEGFVKKLEESDFEIEYVNELMTHSWGQKVVRFYDLDGNLIEVGTPVN